MITYKIEEKRDDTVAAWTIVAIHADGLKRVVRHSLTEGQARQALQRMEAVMAAEYV
jgi:hypothetical protein